MSFERPSPEEMGIKPEVAQTEVPTQQAKPPVEERAREAAHDRLRASGEKSRVDFFTGKIATLENEIKEQEARRSELEAAGTDVGPDSDFEKNLARSRAELEHLQENRSAAEKDLSGFNESGLSKSDSEVIDRMHIEANWNNAQVAIRDGVIKAKGHLESGQTIERLFNWAQRAQSLDRFNEILQNTFDQKIRDALREPGVQDVLRNYYQGREQGSQSTSK